MALIGDTNALHSNQMTGQPNHNVLSVMDAVIDGAPYETPMIAMVNRGPVPKDRVEHWMSDYGGKQPTSMGDVSTRNEGDDASPNSITNRVFYKNNLHLIGDSKSVTHTHQLLTQYGIDDEYYNQQERLAKQLIRQANFAIMRSQIDEQSAGPNSGSSGLWRKMGGIRDQIMNPSSYIAAGSQRTGEEAYDNLIGADNLTEDHINTMLGTMWQNGGIRPTMVGLCNKGVKESISALFAPTSGSGTVLRRSPGQDDRSVTLPIDKIFTEYGELDLMLDHTVVDSTPGASEALHTGDLLVISPEEIELRVLQDLNVTDLAKTGSSWKFLMEWEGTLCLITPNTAGLLRGIAA